MTTDNQFWRLRLSDQENWQQQYTGFDPSLELPAAFDEKLAQDILCANARFGDALIKQQDSLRKLSSYFINFRRSLPLEPLLNRAYFNTSVIHYSVTPGASRLLHYIEDYTKEKLPTEKPLAWEVGKTDSATHEKFVQSFLDKCRDFGDKISARGFWDYLSTRVKVQYVESWLLYMGQTLNELQALPDLPQEHKATVERINAAYVESGMDGCVQQIRKLASSEVAQTERRTKISKDMGEPRGVCLVGAIETGPRVAAKPGDEKGIC